jgi:hypothetical protein
LQKDGIAGMSFVIHSAVICAIFIFSPGGGATGGNLMQKLFASTCPNISVTPVGQEWQVLIEENGRETVINFLIEEHARSFADSQRIRLKLRAPRRRKGMDGEAGIIATNAM